MMLVQNASMNLEFWKELIQTSLKEDDFYKNPSYSFGLGHEKVLCKLKIKSDLVLCGLIPFFETFNFIQPQVINYEKYLEFEGKSFAKGFEIEFVLPFDVLIHGERTALNILSRASATATLTQKFTSLAALQKIKILDTRKTTPGFRALEKYAVKVGGGENHRFGSSEILMIKDNHKVFYGGLKQALDAFHKHKSFYTPIVVEIHSLQELTDAIEYQVKHVLLDNFSKEMLLNAVKIKPAQMTYEVSGGVRLENIENYLIDGIDAISIGALTHNPPPVDLSLKVVSKI